LSEYCRFVVLLVVNGVIEAVGWFVAEPEYADSVYIAVYML